MCWRLSLLLSLLVLVTPAQGAISFINAAVNSVSPNGTMSVAMPTNCTTGDLLIVAWAVGDDNLADQNIEVTGFTEVQDLASLADTEDTQLYVGYRVVVGGDTQGAPSTGTFTSLGGTNASNAAVVMCFRGVDPATVFSTESQPATGQDSSDANPAQIATASGDVVVIAGATGHTGGDTATYTCPANYTTNCTYRAHNDTVDVLVGMGYRTSGYANPEDPGVFTAATIGTASANSWAAVTMALKEYVAPTCTAGLNLPLTGVGGCP